MSRKTKYTHTKYGKREFESSYVRAPKTVLRGQTVVVEKGDRVFQLSNGKRVVSLESFQLAELLGWKKVK